MKSLCLDDGDISSSSVVPVRGAAEHRAFHFALQAADR